MIRSVCFSLVFAFAVSSCYAQLEYQPRTVLPAPMRAITNPPIAALAAANVDDNELVIGVVVNDKPRAYPINQLTGPHREIINDDLGGMAIAATW